MRQSRRASTAISCSGEVLTFTVLSASCADAVNVINEDLRSKDEDQVARDLPIVQACLTKSMTRLSNF